MCGFVTAHITYKYALPWAIHERASGGRIMYFMVHAADHPEAMKLMYRAYRNVQPHAPVPEEIQFEGFGDL